MNDQLLDLGRSLGRRQGTRGGAILPLIAVLISLLLAGAASARESVDTIKLGQTLRIGIPEGPEMQGVDPSKLVLVLNGWALKDLPVEVQGKRLVVTLDPAIGARERWAKIIGAPSALRKKVEIELATADGKVLPIRTSGVLQVIAPAWLLTASVIVLMTIAIVLFTARFSGILRDPGVGADQGKTPLSLGRCQMAFWFILVLASYLFVWLVIGGSATLSQTALILLGISAGTGVGSILVDASKGGGIQGVAERLVAQRDELRIELAELQAAAATGATVATRVQVVQAELQGLERLIANTGQPMQKEGFLRDLLTDANGWSLHRLQLAIWTLVLGLVFLRRVYAELALPDLDSTLLALMGISSGTYIGFKIPEIKG